MKNNRTINKFNLNCRMSGNKVLFLQSAPINKLDKGLGKYLTRTLSSKRSIDNIALQNAFNSRVIDQSELQSYQVNPDYRIYELLVGIAVQYNLREFSAPNMHPYLFWESYKQPKTVQAFTNSTSGSQDGYILYVKDGEKGAYPLTIEAKSTMINPYKSSPQSLTERALSILERKKRAFQSPNQVNILFILPQPNELNFANLNLHPIVEQLNGIMGDNSVGMIAIPLLAPDGIRLVTYNMLGQQFIPTISHLKEYKRAYSFRYVK